MNVAKIYLKEDEINEINPNEFKEGEIIKGHVINLTAESPVR